ncbi:MAG: hypothetical protein ACKVQC_02175 [Elusimicrobiota bacterium]
MYLIIEENPNCEPDERVFSESGDKKSVLQIQLNIQGHEPLWYDIISVDKNNQFSPAHAYRIEDSSDGTAWLIFGGAWGIRLKNQEHNDEWSLTNKNQFGYPFLVLESSGKAIRFS